MGLASDLALDKEVGVASLDLLAGVLTLVADLTGEVVADAGALPVFLPKSPLAGEAGADLGSTTALDVLLLGTVGALSLVRACPSMALVTSLGRSLILVSVV